MLVTEAEAGDFLLAWAEVACCFGGVGDDGEGGDGCEDRGESLDEEEEPPGGDGGELGEFYNDVG